MPVARIRNCYHKIFHLLLLPVLIHVFCDGQGRLIYPPSRASMWRYGFRTKPDYNDANVNCGGFDVQWRQNQGRCGYCGDRWDIPEPRPHERGGTFAKGIVVANFTQGQKVTLTVHVTRRRPSFHTGYFEYRLCPRNHVLTLEEEQCFDHILELASSPGTTRAEVGNAMGKVSHEYQLPSDLTCAACILQWRYVIDTGKSKPQYRACADIAIHPAKIPTTRTPDDLPDYPVNPIQRDYDLQVTLAPQPPPSTSFDITRITTVTVTEDVDRDQVVTNVEEDEHDTKQSEKVMEKDDDDEEEEEEKGVNSSPLSLAPFSLLTLAIVLSSTFVL